MVSIPNDVFSLYKEFADEMITSFGVNCQLNYIQKIQSTVSSVPTVKKSKSMRTYNKTEEFVQNSNYESVRTTDDVKLRVYWTRKDFKKISDIVIPDGGIMTIGYLSDLPKVRSCEFMVPNTEQEAYLGVKFIRVGQPIPWGIKKDRYFVCGWEQE